MIIDFIGPPGAGKTTLLPAVAGTLAQRGLTAYTAVEAARPFAQRSLPGAAVRHLAPQRLRRPLSWALYRGLSAVGSVRYFAGHGSQLRMVLASQRGRRAAAQSRERRVLYWYFRQAGDYAFLRSQLRSDEALIFDEGFAHRAVQLFASAVERPQLETIQSYLALLPQPELVIAVMAPVEICEQRIHDRGLWRRMDGNTADEITRFVGHAHLASSLVLAAAREAGWPVIVVDNGGDDPSLAARELSQALSHHPLQPDLEPAWSTSVA